jgi:hypothetical protein
MVRLSNQNSTFRGRYVTLPCYPSIFKHSSVIHRRGALSLSKKSLFLFLFLALALGLGLGFLLSGRLWDRVRVASPLQLPGLHVLCQNLVRDLLSPFLELLHVLLENIDSQLLEFSREEFTLLIIVVDLFEFCVIFFEVGQVDVRNVDIRISSKTAVIFDSSLATAERVLVDFRLITGSVIIVLWTDRTLQSLP